jgi:hypothetical protein
MEASMSHTFRSTVRPTAALSLLLSTLLTVPAQATPVTPTPECEVVPPFVPSFSPEVEWTWTATAATPVPTHSQVMMTPIVIDVSGDGIPDVLFNTFNGSNYVTDGILRAVSGADGSELWSVTNAAYRVRGASSIAAGDLDGDLLPEICTVGQSGNNLLCFEHDGTFKMTVASANNWGGPSFADLDGDGSVEILNGHQVFNAAGSLLWTGIDGAGGASVGPISFAADIDQDGVLEVVNDRAIYRADGSLLCRNTAIGRGLAGVGNFDGDIDGEVVVVHNGFVALLDDDCTLLWNTAIPGGGAGGAPNIADFDNDGQAEIGVAGRSFYAVFETDGTVKWSSAVQDFSSNRTGSSTFDFEGDGASEVVYADERRLRIYNGATGAVRFDVAHSSGTTYENPVIVDVDGDGNAEIVTANNNYAFPGIAGIRVWRDANDGWVNTRGIWNQHAYSVTNVNEDGTIPAYPDTNWMEPGLNTFRSNSQGTGTTTAFAAPDLVVADVTGVCIDGTYEVVLNAHIHNQGQAPVAPGLEVAFYLGDPSGSGAVYLGSGFTASVIPALGGTDVSLQVVAPGGADDVYAVVDAGETEVECREDNNTDYDLVDLDCTPNEPPLAVCTDLWLSADETCSADGSVDGGSYDPDGGPISLDQSPVGPYGPGSTGVSLEVCDDYGDCDTCEAVVTVTDDTPPTVACNVGPVTPATVPAAFTATGGDNCDVSVEVHDLSCFRVLPNGNVQDRTGSCVVSLVGATATITDTAGVGTHITWSATATDSAGNSTTELCEVVVGNPGNGSGCNQGVGNGPEGCDPGNSNQGNPANTNDEAGGTPGNPGKRGGRN